MVQRTRHFVPSFRAWDQSEARASIQEIAADATSKLDPAALWPAHPMDDGVPDGHGSLYFGAAGVAWALHYLRPVHCIANEVDLAPLLTIALERNAPWFAATGYSGHASLLMGELGILLAQMRVAPDQGLADEIYVLAASNSDLPIAELMWGLPGSMLTCVHMNALAGDVRFQTLFQAQAVRLLADLEMEADGPIWTQDLYGRRQRWLGPVHGFAGNMLPLLCGWDWLAPAQRASVADAVPRTLASHAVLSELGANWPGVVPSSKPPTLMPALSWRSWHGDNVRGCAFLYSGPGGLAHPRRRVDLERRAPRQGIEPVPWHGRERLRVP